MSFGFVKWCGRSHVEYSQIWREAHLPVEVLTNPPRWLLRKRLLKNWVLPFGRGWTLWRIREEDREKIIGKVGRELASKGEVFEVEE
jgi:hypothetical protein